MAPPLREGRVSAWSFGSFPVFRNYASLVLGKALAPYEEFVLGGKTYYLSLGGSPHRKEPGSEEEGGFFCGYLDDEFWHHLKNYLKVGKL